MPHPSPFRLNRRAFLQGSSLLLASAGGSLAMAKDMPVDFRIGMITDLHYAEKPPTGKRHYHETLAKLDEARRQFADPEAPVDMVVELGDLIDAGSDPEIELGYLETVNKQFRRISEDRHYVIGNHCIEALSKAQFLGAVGQHETYYSFDRGDWHFVVLDACFTSGGQPYQRKNFVWHDANVSAKQLRWLSSDLAANDKPTIVFTHQRLDNGGSHAIRNAAKVRTILELSRNVQAVFQGHSHQNDYQYISGIHYCSLVAMVEGSGADSNGYAMLELLADGSLQLKGFRKQAEYNWSRYA